jgi:hypothetical protein
MIGMEIKHTLKEIVSNNNMAKFSHFVFGNLYYTVGVDDQWYQFVIPVSDEKEVGTAVFPSEIKAITLMRYIRISMEKGELIPLRMMP